MEEINRELRCALSRLLTSTLFDPTVDEVADEIAAAREEAAKALLRIRARSGADWTASTDADSFLERWRQLSSAKVNG
jgi:hypothetical protein